MDKIISSRYPPMLRQLNIKMSCWICEHLGFSWGELSDPKCVIKDKPHPQGYGIQHYPIEDVEHSMCASFQLNKQLTDESFVK